MAKTIFTESQKKAHDISRNLSVTANAGSGKTTVLVSRFLDILLNTETKTEEIVAITFTEKAGAELKKKISDAIDNLLINETNQDQLKKIEFIRDHLSFSNISTIHSFCAKLLRHYPVEAEIDVGFSILEGMYKSVIENEAIDEALNKALLNQAPENCEDIKKALRLLKKNQFKYFIKSLLLKREQIKNKDNGSGIFDSIFANEPNKIIHEWNQTIQNYVVGIINDSYWETDFEYISKYLKPDKKNHFQSLIKIREGEAFEENVLDTLNKFFPEFLTKDLTIRKNILVKEVDETDIAQANLKLGSFWKSIKDLVHGFLDPKRDSKQMQLIEITKVLFRLYTDAENIYERKKNERSFLDYEDLQLKARELMKNKEITEKLSEKYKFIMIDEFQDTNFLQYKIFLPLLNDLKSGNLFIVGDPKQSIYAFRNAEVEIFNKTKEDILFHAKPDLDFSWQNVELQSTNEEKKGQITLGESFRLLTNNVCFVNSVFSKIMGKSGYEFEVNYEELIKGRCNSANGVVELMVLKSESLNGNEEKKTTKELVSEECGMIAKRILKLYEDKYKIYDKQENPHDFQFKDAAILLRSRNNLKILEQHLNKYRIPYVITGGIGFYQTQEIYDFFNYFQFLLNNHDDVALVGIMRSPFFSISDSELFSIASIKKTEDFWSKVKIYSEKSTASEQLKRCVDILTDNIQYANRLPIPLLVQRIIRQTGWLGTIAGISHGEQSRLNIEKLLRIAREFEGKGFTNLFDFIERLKNLIDVENREGQANLDVDGNAVQVMTIHSAKGLEFPVVFIPFCHSGFSYDSQPFFDNEVGLGFEILNEGDSADLIQPLTYLYLKHKIRVKNIAEEKRIFYVACTRAKDVLIFSGNDNEESESYFGWITNSLNIDKTTVETGQLNFKNLPVKTLERIDESYQISDSNHDLLIRIILNGDDIELHNDYSKLTPAKKNLDELYIEPLIGKIYKDYFSATQIQTFLECPVKYYLKYKLGLPEQNKPVYKFDENEDPDDLLKGELTGLLFHEILEKHQSYDESELKNFISEFCFRKSPIGIAECEKTDSILRVLKVLYESEFVKNIFSSKEFRTEFTINTVFYDDYLTGTIDFLYKNGENWSFVDYKTDNIPLSSIKERTLKYLAQLRFYALLISRLFSQKNVTGNLLFTKYPDKPQSIDFSENEINEFADTILQSVNKIKSNSFEHNKNNCSECRYFINHNCIKKS